MPMMLCVTIILEAALALPGGVLSTKAPEDYTSARQAAVAAGKPMVVMVGTDWCPPCQSMKKTILPRVRQRGLLRKVVFAVVNPDRESQLAQEITGGGPIPQLVMFRRSGKGWLRTKLVGGQSVEAVEEFINEGLVSDKTDPKKDGKRKS